jgi:hypothetical protein
MWLEFSAPLAPLLCYNYFLFLNGKGQFFFGRLAPASYFAQQVEPIRPNPDYFTTALFRRLFGDTVRHRSALKAAFLCIMILLCHIIAWRLVWWNK